MARAGHRPWRTAAGVDRRARAAAVGASWQQAEQAPGDRAIAVGQHQVLGRDAHAVGDPQRVGGIARPRHAQQAEVDAPLPVRSPAQREQLAVGLAMRDRAPVGFFHVEIDRVAAGDRDAFAMPAHARASRGGDRRAGPFALPVEVVAVAVGEAPGDVPVAADDHARQAGQGHALHVDAAAGRGGIGVAQAGAEPQVGCAQAEVHVVGDDRAAIRGQRAGDREIVAPGRALGRGGPGCGTGRRGQPPQVEQAGRRQRRVAARRALQRCVPARAVARQQGMGRIRQVRANPPQREFARVVGILQVEVHRHADQRAVLGAPRRRRLPQQQVGPGPHAQCRDPGIRAGHVRIEHRALVAGDARQVGHHPRAHAVQAMSLVGVHRDRAEQRGQFAGGGATQQVHLEVAFLCVHIAERAHRVGFAAGIDGDRAVGVARDRGRRGQPGQRLRALQRRQAAAQQPPGQQQDRRHARQQRQRAALEPSPHRDPRGGRPAGRRRLHQKGSLARWQALRQDRPMTAARAALNNRNNASPPRVGD